MILRPYHRLKRVSVLCYPAIHGFPTIWETSSHQLSGLSNEEDPLLARWPALPDMCETRTWRRGLYLPGPAATID